MQVQNISAGKTAERNHEAKMAHSRSDDSFHRMLQSKQQGLVGPQTPKPPAVSNHMLELGEQIVRFQEHWGQVQTGISKRISNLPKEIRPMMQVQVEVNQLNLEAQVLSHLGEAASSTLRKLQQMGSN